MHSLANHILKLQTKQNGNPRLYVNKTSYGIGILDIGPSNTDDRHWYNAWNNIVALVKKEGYTCCDEWLTASKFKAWFDEHRCQYGSVTNLFSTVPEPKHFSPETTCIVPRTVAGLAVRTSQHGRVGLRGVNYRQRANSWAYQAMLWDPIKKRPVPTLTDTELGAHLMWGKSHVARIRAAIKDDVVNKNTKALIEKFCVAVEEYIAAGKHIDIFGVNK